MVAAAGEAVGFGEREIDCDAARSADGTGERATEVAAAAG